MARFGFLLSIFLAAAAISTEAAPVDRSRGNNQCNRSRQQTSFSIRTAKDQVSRIARAARGNTQALEVLAGTRAALGDSQNALADISKAIRRGQDPSAESRQQLPNSLATSLQNLQRLNSSNQQLDRLIRSTRSSLSRAIRSSANVVDNCRANRATEVVTSTVAEDVLEQTDDIGEATKDIISQILTETQILTDVPPEATLTDGAAPSETLTDVASEPTASEDATNTNTEVVETESPTEVVETEAPTSTEVVETEAPTSTEVVETEAPTSTEVVETESSTEVVETEAPTSTEVVETEVPTSTEVTETESPTITEAPAATDGVCPPNETVTVTETPEPVTVTVTAGADGAAPTGENQGEVLRRSTIKRPRRL